MALGANILRLPGYRENLGRLWRLLTLFVWGGLVAGMIFPETQAQISTFPHTETFESGPGGWLSAGLINSWSYGTPSTGVISGCGQGNRCWCTNPGGLYYPRENSILVSPRYDLSSLSHPMLFFMLIWETEQTWDGVGIQYSTDNGANWFDFPVNSPPSCFKQNWFTHNFISWNDFPSNNPGWSGNVTNIVPGVGSCTNGGGPGNWVIASHCLTGMPGNLGDENNVRFRFTFGSGNVCEDEGAAIDFFTVQESPNVPDFSWLCSGVNTLDFEGRNLVSGCSAPWSAWQWEWDFGDSASGGSNRDSVASPTHAFSAPGSYSVKLISTNPCGRRDSVEQVVTVTGCILPVEGFELDGEFAGGKVELEWRVEREIGVAGYMVERSVDAEMYYEVGMVEAENGSGQATYQWTDWGIPEDAKAVFYRIRVRDLDGQEYEGAWIELEVDREDWELEVYPNPVWSGEILRIVWNLQKESHVRIRVIDLAGKEVVSEIKAFGRGIHEFEVPVAGWAAGLYSIQLSGEGVFQERKIWIR